MAEGEAKQNESSEIAEATTEKGDSMECAVCLQPCVHPAQLPCGHIFCFLCIKGIANQSKKCAMCRKEIPMDFIEHPTLLHADCLNERTETFDGTYQWFYEGRNGWWQYDERTSKELETCYKSGERICELLIAGFLYVADLETMLQIRRNDPSRRRRIKRDFATIPKKGIAGLRTGPDQQTAEEADRIEGPRPHTPTGGPTDDDPTPTTPLNTPQMPTMGRQSPQQDELEVTMNRIRALRLSVDRNFHRDDAH